MPMPVIEFDTGNFGANQDPIEVEKSLHKYLEGLAQSDRAYLLANPGTKPLYQLGLRYIRDPLGKEVWRGIESLIKNGGGDCKSLAAARVSELRLLGEPVKFVLRKKVVGDWVVYHVQVLRADGAVEDPSAIMGMKDAFDMGVASRPVPWVTPAALKPIMTGTVQSVQGAPVRVSPKVAGILHRMGVHVRGLDGMQLYQIGLDGMQLYHLVGRR